MNIMNIQEEQLNTALKFQYSILKDVSRSFALTIPELPEPLKVSVANGYLLCRITDTIEDELNLSLEQKTYFHNKFIEILQGKQQINLFVTELMPLLSSQTKPAEKLLISKLEQVLYITDSLPKDTQSSLKKCAIIMNKGMQEFEKIINIRGLKNLTELEKYCYIVAGVVGEMLTELFYKYLKLKNFNLSLEYHNKLMILAKSFGQALQLTNILKDRWSDYARKICYLPKDIFGEVLEKINLSDLLNNSVKHDYSKYNIEFKNNIKELININFKHMKNALDYILLIPKQETGIRKFCLWAIGMAIDILANIKNNPGFTNVAQIKLSKSKLKRMMLITNFIARSNYLLKIWFRFKSITAKL